jgi:hypothetical protein
MGEIERFRAGGRVRHLKMGIGTVASVDGDNVRVIYDAAWPARQDGKPTIGVYDKAWFRRSGSLLFPLPAPRPGTGGE